MGAQMQPDFVALVVDAAPPATSIGAGCGSRTHDLRITSALLWPAELTRRVL